MVQAVKGFDLGDGEVVVLVEVVQAVQGEEGGGLVAWSRGEGRGGRGGTGTRGDAHWKNDSISKSVR